ncbi:MAG: tetratricopeptide repeat protein [Roseburia sp.]
MDKYEYKLKLDEMKNLAAGQNYGQAAAVADSINWRRVRNVNALMKAGEIYVQAGRYDEAKDVLLMAYDRSPIGRMIIYRLAEIAIKTQKFDEAQEYYQEFVEIAPHDNLRYVLRYEMQSAQNADVDALIQTLEEFKEQEYTERWAYELAYLYHKAGRSEDCIRACDELILWFGDGPYVEKALELKMLYQPLNKIQEDKYRQFKQRKEGITEVRPEDLLDSGEIIPEPVQIPQVTTDSERFNTLNLQEELARSMRQIMEATEKEEVADTMEGIKKIVEEIPYLQIPQEQETDPLANIPTDEEIDGSLRINFQEMLAEDYDGQISLMVPERNAQEKQITGQMSIDEILEEWEHTKRAAELALQEAEQQKLESAKAKALAEAGNIMERLASVIPQLDAGVTPKELLEKEYLSKLPEEEAGQLMVNMNDLLQQQIDSISQANAEIDELLAQEKQEPSEEVLPEIAMPEDLDEETPLEPGEEFPVEEGAQPESAGESMIAGETETVQETESLPEISLPEDLMEEVSGQEEQQEVEEELPEIAMPDYGTEDAPTTKLKPELRSIFTYFVPVTGMEPQLCRVMDATKVHFKRESSARTGNILIIGDSGSGKTVLATSLVKALQKECNQPNHRVGKIDAESLNKKDVVSLLKKVEGGCLIIEKAGDLKRETAVKLSLALETDNSGLLVIMEDTKKGIAKALGRDESFARKFTEKIELPIFTSDELVSFAKSYSRELGYTIEAMAVLALYNRISSIQRLEHPVTLTEVKEIVDEAIANAGRFSLKKALFTKKKDDEDYIILREKDFEE